MKRLDYAAAALALALICAAPCAPALANDFFPPSPVPSSRNNIKPRATTKQAQTDVNNRVLNQKIVKTTKAAGSGATPTTRGPGAL